MDEVSNEWVLKESGLKGSPLARMDKVNNEWVLKECGLKGSPLGKWERSVLPLFGHVERMNVDRVTKQIYEGRVYGSKEGEVRGRCVSELFLRVTRAGDFLSHLTKTYYSLTSRRRRVDDGCVAAVSPNSGPLDKRSIHMWATHPYLSPYRSKKLYRVARGNGRF
ncbi:unnamed protein product [Timema podura]|uniref:Uncharacterized protein n=1 Tax=Timema podura TaxID=61482 RepID=A0ABN7P4S2_TIMPD|nr:unnamed protein product [Timema podura]